MNKYKHIWLISTDKDWDLLINKNISRFSYRSRKEITLKNWDEFYEYNPEDHISIKVLQGDSGDNVPGVVGIGDKRATALVNKYGDALNIYDILPLSGTQKFIKNLNNFGDQIIINYKLMDLVSYCEDAIGDKNTAIIDGVMNGK